MIVTVDSSGGFAGMRSRHQVDVSQLEESAATQLKGLVASAGLEGTETKTVPASPGSADVVHYRISVETEAGTSSVTYSDTFESPEYDALANFVRQHGKG